MDTSELLQSKENIQPLRQGRVTSMLCAGLQAQTDSDAERLLQQQREKFEMLIRDNIEDELAVWFDYVNWIEQSYPSHCLKANINVILKKCINKLKNKEKYNNDERFVKICLKYATLHEGTLEIFNLLYSHKIGVRCAIFYIAWAEVYALAESYKKADLVYQKGIDSLAQPIEMLKEAHRAFQAFLVRKMLNDAEMFKPTSEIIGQVPARQACNKLQTLQKNLVPHVRVGENVSAPGRFPVAQEQPVRNEGFQVYQADDDEVGGGVVNQKKIKIKSHSVMAKENLEKPGHWNKHNKDAVFSMPGSSSGYEVHVDDETEQPQPKNKAPSLSSALKPKQVKDEFNLDLSELPLFCPEPHDPTKIARYCKDEVYAGGMEFQFEELRAIKYWRKMAEATKAKSVATPPKTASSVPKLASVRNSLKLLPSEEARTARRKIALDGGEGDRRSNNFARPGPVFSSGSSVQGITTVTSSASKIGHKPIASESPVNQSIHTKEAFSEVQELWCAEPKQAAASLNVFVDDSCLEDSAGKNRAEEAPTRKTLFAAPAKFTEPNKPCRKTIGFLPPSTPVPLNTPKASEDNQERLTARQQNGPFDCFNVDFSKMPIFIAEPYDPTKRAMYCKEQVYAGGVEFQWEEIKARKYLQRIAEKNARSQPATASKVNTATKGSLHEPSTSKRSHSSSTRKSNFGGVRKQLNLELNGNFPKPDVSESFQNQTIHTKEAVNEMQRLWFSKPESPPKQPEPGFQIFVDQSCLEKSGEAKVAVAPTKVKLADIPLDPIDGQIYTCKDNKENSAPPGYDGPVGKSTRPVSGVLTPSENVPFAPRSESDEDDVDSDEGYEIVGNMTGVTENFTQAFQMQKIPFASTPNNRHAMPRPEVNNESVYLPPAPEDDYYADEQPLNFKTMPSELKKKEDDTETSQQHHQLVMPNCHRTLPEQANKNLSIIVETSREYKSSSSGSGASTCSKVLLVTPGESRFEGYSKRFTSYSQTEKTPYAFKTQSSTGYEASGEMSVHTGHYDMVERLQAVPEQDEGSSDRSQQSVSAAEKELSVGIRNISLETVPTKPDIDPFCSKLLDSFLEQMNFPTKHHVPGCIFTYSLLPAIRINSTVTVSNKVLELKKLLGEGAYAKVYRVVDANTGKAHVVKYQKPAFAWEFYIAREIRARCSPHQVVFFMNIEEGYFYENASLFLTAPVEYGDLLTALNLYRAKQGNRSMSDYLAMYFSAQILEIVEVLHSLRIIHGDIKPDNFLIKKLDGKLQLELIDFGRSIDMTLFPLGTSFTRVVTTEGFTCIEMQTNRPWTYQFDLYCVAASMHCLLFGEYMKVQEKNGVWGITKAIPRYIAKSGWKELFTALLNIPSCAEMPNLAEWRSKFNDNLRSCGQNADLIKLRNFLEER